MNTAERTTASKQSISSSTSRLLETDTVDAQKPSVSFSSRQGIRTGLVRSPLIQRLIRNRSSTESAANKPEHTQPERVGTINGEDRTITPENTAESRIIKKSETRPENSSGSSRNTIITRLRERVTKAHLSRQTTSSTALEEPGKNTTTSDKNTISRRANRMLSQDTPPSRTKTKADQRKSLLFRLRERLHDNRQGRRIDDDLTSDKDKHRGSDVPSVVKKESKHGATRGTERKSVWTRLLRRESSGEDVRKAVRRRRPTVVENSTVNDRGGREAIRVHRNQRGKAPAVVYYDRPHRTPRAHRYVHVYRDYHDRICHRIIWPRYRYIVNYGWGPHWVFRFVYPYYHRKYIFVSIGGYWPVGYSYVRYYWYGCHPYIWCGYDPVPRQIRGDTYNYYTYNYYDTGTETTCQLEGVTEAVDDYLTPVDHTTFADIREKLAQQSAEPAPQTQADINFEQAVQAFESGDYMAASEKFAAAIELAPEDMVLPFAYAQALFANEQYSQAADVLREALIETTPEKEGVFYPRGLYADDEVLIQQIEHLLDEVEQNETDADLLFLLGYQLFGIGETDTASALLEQAGQDPKNTCASKVLLDLLEKIKAENISEHISESEPTQNQSQNF